MKSFTIQRLQWLIGCALVLQTTDSIQTIVHYFFAPPNISPLGVYNAWLVFNIFALAFRLTTGYLFLFGSPALGVRLATFLFLGLRAVTKLFSAPLFLLRWHEGMLQPYRAENIADGIITGAVVCCVVALIVTPKNEPNQHLRSPGQIEPGGEVEVSGCPTTVGPGPKKGRPETGRPE